MVAHEGVSEEDMYLRHILAVDVRPWKDATLHVQYMGPSLTLHNRLMYNCNVM